MMTTSHSSPLISHCVSITDVTKVAGCIHHCHTTTAITHSSPAISHCISIAVVTKFAGCIIMPHPPLIIEIICILLSISRTSHPQIFYWPSSCIYPGGRPAAYGGRPPYPSYLLFAVLRFGRHASVAFGCLSVGGFLSVHHQELCTQFPSRLRASSCSGLR